MLAFLLLPAAVQQQGTALLAPELAADHISSQLPPPRQHELQRKTYRGARRGARARSDAATPELLALLDSSSFRQQVATYVPSLANETADDLLERLRSIFATAEILHNFDGVVGCGHERRVCGAASGEHFASTFEVRYASESESEAAGGDGTAAADADKQQSYRVRHKDATANQGIFGLPPFGGDEKPRDYTEATSRLTYARAQPDAPQRRPGVLRRCRSGLPPALLGADGRLANRLGPVDDELQRELQVGGGRGRRSI